MCVSERKMLSNKAINFSCVEKNNEDQKKKRKKKHLINMFFYNHSIRLAPLAAYGWMVCVGVG